MKNVETLRTGSIRGSDRGVEQAGGGASVRDRSPDREQDDDVLGAAGLCAHEAAGAAEARCVHSIIDKILVDDKTRPKKQQHTSKRIFERLRDEHGFTGGITIVKDYVAGWRQRAQEMFVPLVHPPGHAQADFGEAIGDHRWRGAQDPLLRVRPAALGRHLRGGVSGRDDRGVL